MSKSIATEIRYRFDVVPAPEQVIELYDDAGLPRPTQDPLYYTYIFETGLKGKSVVDGGRGTEIFVRRDGKWIDVGWHLDNGAFSHTNGEWTRIGESLPAPAGMAPR